MTDNNSRYPKRIASSIGKEIKPSDHTTWDHIENVPLNKLRHTPSGTVQDTKYAEQQFRRMNPQYTGENNSDYEIRISNAWAEAQSELVSLEMQEYFIKDFTEHQLDDSYASDGRSIGDYDVQNRNGTAINNRPGTTASDNSKHAGFFGGSSTVTKHPSKAGTAPITPDTQMKRHIVSPGYEAPFAPVTDTTRAIVEGVGLSNAEDNTDRNGTFNAQSGTRNETANIKVPLSPLYPFTRMEPRTAHEAVFNSYNRNKIPIADIEHRKAFRHVFFGRPECYIFGQGGEISDQCKQDPDFSSMLSRMPHILALLSPVYCTGTIGFDLVPNCNWNYILSNRLKGFQVTENAINFDEGMTKSVSEYTVSPGGINTSNTGGTLSLSFTDTKRFEIYEMIRMWMTYIHKRKRGLLSPSMDNYNPINQFPDTKGSKPTQDRLLNGHVYNRALEYCAPLFDIITDETMTNILYQCKYYGLYPVRVNNTGLSNAESFTLTEQMNVDVEFRYQARKEGLNMNLVEFNYNAGIVNEVGALNKNIILSHSSPFLSRTDIDVPMNNYMGAAGMFTGTPYIIMEMDMKSIPTTSVRLKNEGNEIQQIITPQLRFMSLPTKRENELNLGIYNKSNISNGRDPLHIKN